MVVQFHWTVGRLPVAIRSTGVYGLGQQIAGCWLLSFLHCADFTWLPSPFA